MNAIMVLKVKAVRDRAGPMFEGEADRMAGPGLS